MSQDSKNPLNWVQPDFISVVTIKVIIWWHNWLKFSCNNASKFEWYQKLIHTRWHNDLITLYNISKVVWTNQQIHCSTLRCIRYMIRHLFYWYSSQKVKLFGIKGLPCMGWSCSLFKNISCISHHLTLNQITYVSLSVAHWAPKAETNNTSWVKIQANWVVIKYVD